jgi:adenine-specific DNA-methyltransferase
VKLISLDTIAVAEDRIRREFSETSLRDLADDIRKNGLYNALVLRNDGKTLNQGERRLRAIRLIAAAGDIFTFDGVTVPPGFAPTILLDEQDEYSALETELHENIKRTDLTPLECAMAVKRLHELRLEQNLGEQTIEDTATELERDGSTHGDRGWVQTANDLIIAEHADDPFVQVAKTRGEALKVIREKKKHEMRLSLLATFDPKSSPHEFIQGDLYATALKPYAERFSCIIADPPYGRSIHKQVMWDGTRHEYDDSDDAFKQMLESLPDLSFFLAAQSAHIYVFCDILRFSELFTAFELSPWTVWPYPVIWHKGTMGSFGGIERGFRRTYEAILFAIKGNRSPNAGYNDVISITQSTNNPHPAGKPVELYVELLNRTVYPGDWVLDPYGGGGTIYPAASQVNCRALAIEQEDKYALMCLERMKGAKKK